IFTDKDNLLPTHITLFTEDIKLFSIPSSSDSKILVNNKISNFKKLININDTISVGTLKFLVKSFQFEYKTSLKQYLNHRVKEISEKEPALIDILKELSE
ncbi:MAG: hypothetical protein OEW87_09380, partial [Flavobacteriaceae bacterium]|nr:hypothetical protein [Flavobacteriaceae bacterium]